MTADLRPEHADAQGVRRLLCEQIDAAAAALAGKRVTDENIHAARKSLKRARATLRLMRDALPLTTYRRENASLRDTARPLRAVRDARILLETFDRLVELYGPTRKRSIPEAFRRELAREQRDVRQAALRSKGSLHVSRRALGRLRPRVSGWWLSAHGWSELGSGLQRVYRQGRKAMAEARRTPSTEALHEWRKQAKYLWHQLEVLAPLRPGATGKLVDQAHELSDCLGDDHDLAVLREKALAHPSSFRDRDEAEALLALIERCQQRLRRKAFRLGDRIYRQKPAAFAARFGRYWRKWADTRQISRKS